MVLSDKLWVCFLSSWTFPYNLFGFGPGWLCDFDFSDYSSVFCAFCDIFLNLSGQLHTWPIGGSAMRKRSSSPHPSLWCLTWDCSIQDLFRDWASAIWVLTGFLRDYAPATTEQKRCFGGLALRLLAEAVNPMYSILSPWIQRGLN